jgi:hypothetical protein
MAMVETITLQLDTSLVVEALKTVQLEFAVQLRSIPVVQAEDGSQWADVTDLLAFADRLEASVKA